ncbi:MAG: hypothetical protein JRG91_12860 [Deltaproteobacteria bacterium]|nr:hypothetical protein [Deltaproteobacteria bacterium]
MRGCLAGGCAALAATWLALAGYARASDEEPTPAETVKKTTLGYSVLLVGRINPLGTKNDFQLHARQSLSSSDHILLKDTFIGANLISSFKPTAVFLGFGAELQPLAILKLTASVQWVRYFTPFDNLVSFPTASAEYGDSAIERLGQLGENYSTHAVYFFLGALLQAKVGPVAVRSELKAAYAHVDLEAGDNVYYEIEWDLLPQNRSWVLFNNTDVLYLAEFGLIAGVRYSLAHAFYDERAFAPGEPHKNPNSPTHRIGPLVGYSFTTKWKAFEKPTLLLIANWWLKHRYRTGQEVHQAIPYIVLAFAFRGTLL